MCLTPGILFSLLEDAFSSLPYVLSYSEFTLYLFPLRKCKFSICFFCPLVFHSLINITFICKAQLSHSRIGISFPEDIVLSLLFSYSTLGIAAGYRLFCTWQLHDLWIFTQRPWSLKWFEFRCIIQGAFPSRHSLSILGTFEFGVKEIREWIFSQCSVIPD